MPGWWVRFITTYPAVPTIVALTGIGLISISLAPINSGTKNYEYGLFIETIRVTFGSDMLVDQAIKLQNAYRSWVPAEIRTWVHGLFGNVTLYLVVPFLLLLEYLFPCRQSQRLISKAFLQDFVWFAVSAPTGILILGTMNQFLRNLFDDHLGFFSVKAAITWPAYLQIITAVLLGELVLWFHHYVRHKVRIFWVFHAVHHSQKELNIFTDDRMHFIDKVVASLLVFVPFYIFQVPNLYAVAFIGMFTTIYTRFLHANVRINLGSLGWILASPQFHRVHHSADPEHKDKNFGGILSLFDHLFGTAYPSRDIYPETGISDSRFPTEDKVRVRQLPSNWLMQTVYPFIQLFKKKPESSHHDFQNRYIRSPGEQNNSSPDLITRQKEL